jgi:hypothetical protein
MNSTYGFGYGSDEYHEIFAEAREAREQDEANAKAYALECDAGPQLLAALVRARSFIVAKVSPAEQARGPLLLIIDAAIVKARGGNVPCEPK